MVIGAAQVTDVVKQTGDQPDRGARPAEPALLVLLPLVTDDEPRQRQCYVERVLAVVLDGVDAVIARYLTGEQPLEVGEGAAQRLE